MFCVLAGGQRSPQRREAVFGGGEQSQADSAWWRGAVSASQVERSSHRLNHSLVEGSCLRWRGVVSGGEKRSQV